LFFIFLKRGDFMKEKEPEEEKIEPKETEDDGKYTNTWDLYTGDGVAFVT
jgi:hypothetical protein